MNPEIDNQNHRKPKLFRVLDTLRICAQIPVGDECPRECPYFIKCTLGNTEVFRDTIDLIEELVKQRDNYQAHLKETKMWLEHFESSYRQVSKALCDKDYGEVCELLMVFNQVKKGYEMAREELDVTNKNRFELMGQITLLQQELKVIQQERDVAIEEKNEAYEAICSHCTEIPCLENDCYWHTKMYGIKE